MKNANPLTDVPLHIREKITTGARKTVEGCHEYRIKSKRGYGHVRFAGREYAAHRVAWVMANGALVDPDVVIHHTCENRSCVNPSHLRAVSQRENLLATESTMAARNFAKTSCKRGHAFTEANTIKVPTGRACKTCHYKAKADYRQRMKACPTRIASKDSHPAHVPNVASGGRDAG